MAFTPGTEGNGNIWGGADDVIDGGAVEKR
jgi:hypothetical protein